MDTTSIQVRRAAEGDQESLGWLVERFHPLLEAQTRLRLGNRPGDEEDVRDVVQETWMVLCGNLAGLQARGGRLAPVLVRFLSSTAMNLCNNLIRKRIRRGGAQRRDSRSIHDPGHAGALEDETRGVVTRAAGHEITTRISQALADLSEPQRQVVVLRLFEQRTAAEVADQMQLTPGAARHAYRSALDALRARLPRELLDDIRSGRRNPD